MRMSQLVLPLLHQDPNLWERQKLGQLVVYHWGQNSFIRFLVWENCFRETLQRKIPTGIIY